MLKKVISLCLALSLVISIPINVYGCNDDQTAEYVSKIIFGDSSAKYASTDNGKALLSAMYLCCEQADNSGDNELKNLKNIKVSGVPALGKINIKNSELFDCSHQSWEYVSVSNSKVQKSRKTLLRNTVNKVFGFGFFNKNDKIANSFSALLYYSHILSDYIADDPSESEITVKGNNVSSFSGQAYVEINGNNPSFSRQQKANVNSRKIFTQDSLERATTAFMNISSSDISSVNTDENNLPNPTGWNQVQNLSFTSTGYLYNRCHLIAHRFCGYDKIDNLITGTRFLNDNMTKFENDINKYIKETNNHVLYRVTPIYKGNNLVASGVQIEAWSVEDRGRGIKANRYYYNVQPGIDIDYETGKSEIADITYDSDEILPFVVMNPSDNNPDLIYSVNKHFEVLFADQKDTQTYKSMIDDIKSTANEARQLLNSDDKSAYIKLNKCKYQYLETLEIYVPLLLQKEKYFSNAFS